MNQATYTYQGNAQQAEVSLQARRLAITLKDGQGGARTLYWYYDSIRKQGYDSFEHPGPPVQTLRPVSSELYAQIVQKAEKGQRRAGRRGGATLLRVLFFLLALVVAFYFFGLPWLAGKMANRFPPDYERQMGDGMYESLRRGFQVDERKTAYVNEFFREMKIPSKYDIRITVVRSKEVNAFAIPGGHIVVYEGILEGMDSYEELAALLAHEFTHVEQRHSLRSIFREYSSRIFLALLFGQSDVVSSVLIGNADQLKGLSYSRSLETEADEEGAALLAARRIDCAGFVRLFELLKKESAGQRIPEFVNSHPNLDRRIESIRDLPACRNNRPLSDTALQSIFGRISGQLPSRNW